MLDQPRVRPSRVECARARPLRRLAVGARVVQRFHDQPRPGRRAVRAGTRSPLGVAPLAVAPRAATHHSRDWAVAGSGAACLRRKEVCVTGRRDEARGRGT
eukprot:574596-Prymnesium_polylepis.2